MTQFEFSQLKYWDRNTLDYQNKKLFTEDVIANTDFRLMQFLEDMYYHIRRFYPNAVMIFHCLYESRNTGGQHPLGLAADFHLAEVTEDGGIQAIYPDFKRDVDFVGMIINKMAVLNLVGWGIYPQWAHPGHHIDIRSVNLGSKEGGWRWGRLNNSYVNFEEAYKEAGATFR